MLANKSIVGPLLIIGVSLVVVGISVFFLWDDQKTPVEEQPTAAARRPNILLMMVDDLGFNDLAINNNNASITTPNLDELARQGVRFTRHYANSVCSTARAALLSGQYPARNGYMAGGRGLSPQLTTLPKALKSAGYTTWHIGKWHIGDLQRQAWPDYQGFDHWFGFLNQWRLAGKTKNGEIQLKKPRYKKPWLESDTEPGAFYNGHLENILTDKAISVMKGLKQSEAPWYINLWFYAPHSPIQPSKKFARLYADTDVGRYRALVHQLDSNIGKILSYLDRSGLRDNTIVIVVSDNGGTNRQIDNNSPYFGSKATFLEGGLRTPLIIQWPNSSTSGTVYSDTISIQDIYPTLLDSIGQDVPPGLDGRSVYAAIKDSSVKPTPRAIFWETGSAIYGALSKDGRWRLYQPISYFSEPSPSKFYDLKSDPSGENPIDPAPEEFFAPLKKEYLDWHRDVHQVKTQYAINQDGTATLTGMDFLRTPGFGAYTFGVGFSGAGQTNLAKQGDIWQMKFNGDSVDVAFGDIRLSGTVDPEKRCHSAILSGLFYRHTCSFCGPDRTTLSLYVDGQHTQTIEVDGAINVEEPSTPIYLGSTESPTQVGAPVVLNVQIQSTPAWTAASLNEQLCRSEIN